MTRVPFFRPVLSWAWRVLVALDILLNALTGGWAGETLSHRAYRGVLAGRQPWKLLCKILHWFDHNHCAETRQ